MNSSIIQIYRKTISIFLLVVFTSYSALSYTIPYNNLPFKIKETKVEVKLHDGSKIKGWLVEANIKSIQVVNNKEDIQRALLSNCNLCQEILLNNIKEVKVKKSHTGLLLTIGTYIVGLIIIFISPETENPDGLSDRDLFGLTYAFYGGIFLSLYFLILYSSSRSHNRIEEQSAKFDKVRQEVESIDKFYKNLRKKSFTFYYDNYSSIIKGKAISVTDNHISVQIKSPSGFYTIEIPVEKLDYVK